MRPVNLCCGCILTHQFNYGKTQVLLNSVQRDARNSRATIKHPKWPFCVLSCGTRKQKHPQFFLYFSLSAFITHPSTSKQTNKNLGLFNAFITRTNKHFIMSYFLILFTCCFTFYLYLFRLSVVLSHCRCSSFFGRGKRKRL